MYKSKRLKKQCEDPIEAQKKYGPKIGIKLTQRAMELISATSLKDIELIPSCKMHRLKGQGSHQYSINLIGPFRLIIQPVIGKDNCIYKPETITVVKIEEVVNYHGKRKKR